MRFEFDRVLQLVDSETVLSMIIKSVPGSKCTKESELEKYRPQRIVTYLGGHGFPAKTTRQTG